MKSRQIPQNTCKNHRHNNQSKGSPLLIPTTTPTINLLNKDPNSLSNSQQQKQDKKQQQSKEDGIVLFADAIVSVKTVMIELLDAAFACMAVVAVFVDKAMAEIAV